MLLKLKHWQLFLIISLPYVIGFIAYFFFVISFLEVIQTNNGIPDFSIFQSGLLKYFIPFYGIFAISILINEFYCYRTGLHLFDKMSHPNNLNRKRFKGAHFGLLSIYLLLFIYFVIGGLIMLPDFMDIIENAQMNTPPNFSKRIIFFYFISFALMMVSSLLLLLARIYKAYFLAYALNNVEKRKTLLTGDYLGDAVLNYFWYIGLWFVVPRFRKIFSTTKALPPPLPGN
jgi:hypothetical protein